MTRVAQALALLLATASACLQAAVPAVVQAAVPVGSDEPQSFVLTTDTPVYCAQLARQVAERHSTILDVQRLLADGREMCERGQTRGGIRRLRRALVILHQRAPGPAP